MSLSLGLAAIIKYSLSVKFLNPFVSPIRKFCSIEKEVMRKNSVVNQNVLHVLTNWKGFRKLVDGCSIKPKPYRSTRKATTIGRILNLILVV